MKSKNRHLPSSIIHHTSHITHFTSYIIFFSLLFISCEKVINVDLNTTDPKLVVEANITDQPGPYAVKLSRSVNYYESNVFPAVTDAIVSISDNAGNKEILQQTSGGFYRTSKLQGVSGRTYVLNVAWNGKIYTATSTMPNKVLIDSVLYQLGGSGFGPGSGGPGHGVPDTSSIKRYRITSKFLDIPGIENFYRMELSSNDSVEIDSTRIQILSDKLMDGQEMSLSFNTRLQPFDTVVVQLLCIDKAIYNFYNTLRAVVGESNPFMSAPPANPVTNISNGGLGYFAAYPVSKKSVIIK